MKKLAGICLAAWLIVFGTIGLGETAKAQGTGTADAGAAAVVVRAELETEMIGVHEQAVVVWPEEELYPARLQMGGPALDCEKLLSKLLGGDYIAQEGGERFSENKEGEVWEIRRARIDEETGALEYFDPMVESERGAENEPPMLGCTREEALELCKEALEGLIPEEFCTQESGYGPVLDRWQSEDDYFYTEEEYDVFCGERRRMRFCFPVKAAGLELLDEGIWAMIGVNGLGSLTVDAREVFLSQEQIGLMPLQKAIEMVSSTRSAEAVLLYAAPVYSDRVSGGEYDLCWYLATDKGNYVVDCVLGAHVCDSWEY